MIATIKGNMLIEVIINDQDLEKINEYEVVETIVDNITIRLRKVEGNFYVLKEMN